MDNLPQRALSIRQPWASAILNAGKDIENRTRRFNYRGPICIHASLYDNAADFKLADDAIWEATGGRGTGYGKGPLPSDRQKRGGIIGVAEIVDCVEVSSSPWFFGPFGLVLRNVQHVRFIPVRGSLGLFDWRRNLVTSHA
jgi:hypothetical protein